MSSSHSQTESYTHVAVNPAREQPARPLSKRQTIHHVSLVAVGRQARGDVAYRLPWGTWGWGPRSNHGLFPWTPEGCRGCWSACRAVVRETDGQIQGGRVGSVMTKDGVMKWTHLNRDCLLPKHFVCLTQKWPLEHKENESHKHHWVTQLKQVGQVFRLTDTKGWLCVLQPGSSTCTPILCLWCLHYEF